MKVSTKGRYALRLMVDIAVNSHGKAVALKEISERQEVSVKYLEQIVTPLNRAKLIKSERGAQGGYRLAKEPKEYTAGEILKSIEGEFAPIACLEDKENQCMRYESCPTVNFWEGLYRVIDTYVESVTLENLVQDYKKKSYEKKQQKD